MGKTKPGFGKCLTSKVAMVTGATRGVGRATAFAFAKEGAYVVGIDICPSVCERSGVKPPTSANLAGTGRQVQAGGRRWPGAEQDQRNIPDLQATALQVEKEFGGIDILFANAGIREFRPLLEIDDKEWQIYLDVNLTRTANAMGAFAPYLVKRGGGRIIVTSSTQGRHRTKYGAAYSASKWGITGLMKSAALELGVYGINVNAVIRG